MSDYSRLGWLGSLLLCFGRNHSDYPFSSARAIVVSIINGRPTGGQSFSESSRCAASNSSRTGFEFPVFFCFRHSCFGLRCARYSEIGGMRVVAVDGFAATIWRVV